MDWNWFFSSLAQSAAAIVGIFGAFIITKILSNQAAYSEKKNRLAELMVFAKKIADSADDLAFDWYNKHIAQREIEDLDELLDKGAEEIPDRLYDSLRFSIYEDREVSLRRIEQHLLIRTERKRKEHEARKDRLGLGALLTPMTGLKMGANLHLRPALDKEREAMDQVVREARHHTRLVSEFLDGVKDNPESSSVITVALMLVVTLFYVGVIYPLSFMPTPLNWTPALSLEAFFDVAFSLKGILLIVVSLIFTGILAVFFFMNIRMKYDSKVVNQLHLFTSMAAYSMHFAIMEKNTTTQGSKS